MKKYVTPKMELVEFKHGEILAESTGCKCFGAVIVEMHEVGVGSECWATTYDNVEVVDAALPFGF